MKKSLILLLLVTAVLNLWAQDAPTVTTDTRYARGATMAFGRASFKINNNNALSERGFCWSDTNSEPTVDDNKSTDYISNSGLIFKMTGLTPATKYYVRAYAKGKNGAIGYGNVIKIYTLPQGNITWDYDNGGSSDENNRINDAVGSCVNYWNNLTNITGLNLSVHYGAQTPTADCSYGGWMRIGPNASYQKTGTVMHEALHAIGVGTHGIWNNSDSPLRAGAGTGTWLGNRATEFIRFWDNSTTATINGDGTHAWPYCINGAHEDDGSENLYTANSLLAQALGEDGLPCSSARSFGSPHYAFDQEDTIKYYIKNEDESYGLFNSYLVETSDHKLQWQKLSATEATATDAAAWYITFTPNNQYYQFRNAATGYYITYTGSGTSGIFTKNTTPSDAQDFHLLRSRVDVTSSTGSTVCPERGYWILHPNNSTATPPALAAVANGKVSTSSFNIKNDAKSQRWLLLTAAQAANMENTGLTSAREAFTEKYNLFSELCNTPHAELQEGADNEFVQTLNTLSQTAANANSVTELTELTEQIQTAGMLYLTQVYATDLEKPFDLTFLLVNPTLASNANGWSLSAGGVWNYQEVEYYQQSVNVVQTVKSMPLGTYQATVQGFQRPGSYTNVYNDYVAGNNNIGARIYIDNVSKGSAKLMNIMSDRSKTSLHSDDKKMNDGTYIPNTMASAAAHFKKGYYNNKTEYYKATAGDLKIVISASDNTGNSYWTIFTNFGLYYLGPLTREEIENNLAGLAEIHSATTEAEIYNLNGMRVGHDASTLAPGIYLQNGRKFTIK